MKRFILIILALLVATTSALPGLSRADESATIKRSEMNITDANLWLVKEGKHTNLVFRTEDAGPILPLREAQSAAGPLVMISWGDRTYYSAQKKTLSMSLKALLLPTSAAVNARSMHSLDETPQNSAKVKIYPMQVTPAKLSRILHRVRSALEIENSEHEVLTPINSVSDPRIGGFFYPADDRTYSLLFTCNNWTADVLNAGQLPFSSLFSQLPVGLMVQHKLGWILFPKHRDRAPFASKTLTVASR